MKWWLGRNAVPVTVSERDFRSYYFKPLLPLKLERKKLDYICECFIGSIGMGDGEIEKKVIYIRRLVKSSGLNGSVVANSYRDWVS